MRVIYGRRQSGRTTTLIELCAEAEKRGKISYIVCHSHQEAYRIAQKAVGKGLQIGFPITYDEFLNPHGKPFGVFDLYIDNADKLLLYLAQNAGWNLKGFVIEKREEE